MEKQPEGNHEEHSAKTLQTENVSTSTPQNVNPATTNNIPDPEEDDLDDLDG